MHGGLLEPQWCDGDILSQEVVDIIQPDAAEDSGDSDEGDDDEGSDSEEDADDPDSNPDSDYSDSDMWINCMCFPFHLQYVFYNFCKF